MRRILFRVAALTVLALAASYARAEQSTVKGSIKCGEDGDCYISDLEIRGVIDDGTLEQVRKRIEDLHKAADASKKPIHPFKVVLDSLGGSVSSAMKIGRLLRREGIGAEIAVGHPPNEGRCVSACILVYAGATHRSFEESFSKLGIHRPYLEISQQELSSSQLQESFRRALDEVRSYLREMNVSERLAEAMFRVEPEKVRYLSREAAQSYGLTEWDPVYSEMADLDEARRLGLKRQEFMERRKQALSSCSWLKSSINEQIGPWLNCYDGVMTGTSQPPKYVAPRGALDLSKFGERVDPINWKRYPY